MYSDDNENNCYVFDGDFTKYLLGYGIGIEHINEMKNKILERDRYLYYEFPPLKSFERDYIALVPIDKVIGTSRGTVGISVYDNVRIMYRGDREAYRFKRCLNFLEEMSLEELKKSYENLYPPVDMVYYVEDDAYFLSNDGNHRTLTAMLVGAKYIRARVNNCHCNTIKKNKYLCCREFMEKYKIESIMQSGLYYDFSFIDDYGAYKVCGYPIPRTENLDLYIKQISQMIDEDIKKVDFIKHMPLIIQKNILYLTRNCRIEEYISKKYLSEKERNCLRYKIPACLLEL